MARSSLTVDEFKVTTGTSLTQNKEPNHVHHHHHHKKEGDQSRDENKTLQRTTTKLPQLIDLKKIMGILGANVAYQQINLAFKRFRGALLNIVVLHNYILMPLYLGLETIQFEGYVLAMEITSMIVYSLDGLTALVDRYSESKITKYFY